ncbi:MAG TPA: hypothetical protein PLV68_20890 [Ilumatobacteraceae bacterium]|nr:hypothetical protein [Ilumatobacteraceae bacterium]
MNLVILAGHLSSNPIERELPSGTRVHNFELTTQVEGAAVTVPLAWIDPRHVPALSVGDEIRVVGSVRRRFFRAGGATQSRTEVVVTSLVRGRDRRGLASQATLIERLMGA